MKPEQQRIVIAELCGWRKRQDHPASQWIAPEGGAWNEVPDYLNDLNAMHEAEKVLSDANRLRYYEWLMELSDRNPDGSRRFGAVVYWETIHSPCPQRAEAFLRTMGKWVE